MFGSTLFLLKEEARWRTTVTERHLKQLDLLDKNIRMNMRQIEILEQNSKLNLQQITILQENSKLLHETIITLGELLRECKEK